MSEFLSHRKDVLWAFAIATVYAITLFAGLEIDMNIQPELIDQFMRGVITPTNLYLLENFYNHVGDIADGFTLTMMAIFLSFPGSVAVAAFLDRFKSHQSKEKDIEASYETFKRVYAFVLITLSGVVCSVILDAELLQRFIQEGIPDSRDIPAGIIGMFVAYAIINGLMKFFSVLSPARFDPELHKE